jgi:hypothetical protein
MPDQGFAGAPGAVPEADHALVLDLLAHHGALAVVERLRALGEGARARPVAPGRDVEPERLVRALVVVDLAPSLERALAVGEIAEAAPAGTLGQECPVEALLLALGLRMAEAGRNRA